MRPLTPEEAQLIALARYDLRTAYRMQGNTPAWRNASVLVPLDAHGTGT